MFDMESDGGQKDLGNTKPPKSRPNKEDETPNEQDDNVKGFATVDKTSAPFVEVIRERKHAKQSQNENCSSTSIRDPTVTRATANRKLGPHKRTPYEDINALKAKANAKTRQVIAHERIMKRLSVGLFRMSNNISEDDRDLLSFAFCCNPLDPKAWGELLVDTGVVAIDRHHFGSLAPGSPLFDDVINVMTEYLYDTTSTKWFLPTYFWSEGAKFVRPSNRMTSCARTHKLCRLVRFNGRLKDCMQLLYLDSVFHDDILSVFGTGWTFSSFSVVSLLDANLIQPNAVNCGIFFIRHMQYYRQLWYDQYNSNVQRMRLAIELLRNEKNQLRDAIIREALKVMKNGYDFMAKGNKIGNVEVKDKDVADVTVKRKRVYIRKQKKSAVTIPETRTGRV
ncbi:hypothetical protein PRUPE_4G261000 [Prunus persica]|uniref:Ubiquitin-like protease family profile domain-containing protein n=1 Tax=Prunus persica TaxID=3760 RepID=A0A251PSN2_PRUPE|nr:uncharacterized protein LOC109948407 isoform X2 [Prunus persica]ONI14080.1 hypothetical protein PRUPE_4G261000 [Prunus persica]